MEAKKFTIEGRDFWFTVEHVSKEDPETGEFTPIGPYYCAFSAREPRPTTISGEVLKDDSGRAKIFPTAEKALAAGVEEVESRLRLPAKAYAVGLSYASKPSDFEAYVKLFQQWGITIDDSTRVADSFGRRWLHVWDERGEAERFANQLRHVTGNRDWEVYDLSPPHLWDGERDGRSDPIEILVGRQGEGATYGLHPNSLKRIRQRFPRVHPRPSVFIGRNGQTDIEAGVETVYNQVAVILTGLSSTQLSELGGYRVVDPLTGLALYQSMATAE